MQNQNNLFFQVRKLVIMFEKANHKVITVLLTINLGQNILSIIVLPASRYFSY